MRHRGGTEFDEERVTSIHTAFRRSEQRNGSKRVMALADLPMQLTAAARKGGRVV
ncbi:MAG: hypothetical protein QOD74_3009 [Variibacter sp.]|nr:hypothetical protein [Variibacter sp.]